MISSLASEVLPGPVGICSTGTSRVPLLPTMRAIAPAAISGGTESAAGEPLHRLPPIEARPRTWIEPISLTPSSTPGQALHSAACSMISMPGTAAPMRKPPFSCAICRTSGIFLMSTMSDGSIRSVSICTMTSVPPARIRAVPWRAGQQRDRRLQASAALRISHPRVSLPVFLSGAALCIGQFGTKSNRGDVSRETFPSKMHGSARRPPSRKGGRCRRSSARGGSQATIRAKLGTPSKKPARHVLDA